MTNKHIQTKTAKCPNCGTRADGNFCPNCGGTLAGANCPKCGTDAQAGAKFCHNCSAPLGAASRGFGSWAPWVAVVAVVLLLLTFAAVRIGPSAPPPPSVFPAPTAPLSPRDVANENFNQSMMASERGDDAAAASFGRIALDGYAALGGLDNDLRLHVGLIYLAMDSLEAALAQAESLEIAVPGHLYASVLRQRAFEVRGDSSGVEAAYRRFLEYHQQEINAGRPEYNEHMQMLERFLTAARAAVANR